MSAIDPWLLDHLACPADASALRQSGQSLQCADGHSFPVVNGVPVLLLDSMRIDMQGSDASLASARRSPPLDETGLFLETIGISDEERAGVLALAARSPAVDPVVTYLVAATNGLMYRHLIGRLERYPIPTLPMAPGDGRLLLDVGCSWGRWTVAAHRAGYRAIGLDPSLGAVMAARRVARALGVPTHYVVGDCRCLPFPRHTFDVAFSYSVLQHLPQEESRQAFREIGRVLQAGGTAKLQMPTRYGVRCLYHQARRGFREPSGFEVRYWSLGALRDALERAIGPTHVEADCYFAIGLRPDDREMMPAALRGVVHASEFLKAASRRAPLLVHAADSVFVEATARPEGDTAR